MSRSPSGSLKNCCPGRKDTNSVGAPPRAGAEWRHFVYLGVFDLALAVNALTAWYANA